MGKFRSNQTQRKETGAIRSDRAEPRAGEVSTARFVQDGGRSWATQQAKDEGPNA